MATLTGKRIAITRAAEQAGDLADRLREHGAEPLVCPTIAVAPPEDLAPLDRAIGHLAAYDWLILTSANGVAALLGRMAERGAPPVALAHLRIGAVGPATARAIECHGLRASFVPASNIAEGLLAEIGDVAGCRFLLPQADLARDVLAEGLRARGASVDAVTAYRTVPGPGARDLAERLRRGAVDVVTFTSPSTARYLLDGMAEAGVGRAEAQALLAGVVVVCIGPVTAAAAGALGLRVDAVAEAHTGDGLVAALAGLYHEGTAP